MSRHIPLSVRSVVLEQLLANTIALDTLLSDSDHYDAAKDILWRAENMPGIGMSVYTDGTHGDIFEREVLEQHGDYTITVTDKAGADRGRKERLQHWRFKP